MHSQKHHWTDRPWSAGEFLSTKKNFMIRQVKCKYKHSFAKVCTLHDHSPIPVNVVKGMNKKENSSDWANCFRTSPPPFPNVEANMWEGSAYPTPLLLCVQLNGSGTNPFQLILLSSANRSGQIRTEKGHAGTNMATVKTLLWLGLSLSAFGITTAGKTHSTWSADR